MVRSAEFPAQCRREGVRAAPDERVGLDEERDRLLVNDNVALAVHALNPSTFAIVHDLGRDIVRVAVFADCGVRGTPSVA